MYTKEKKGRTITRGDALGPECLFFHDLNSDSCTLASNLDQDLVITTIHHGLCITWDCPRSRDPADDAVRNRVVRS